MTPSGRISSWFARAAAATCWTVVVLSSAHPLARGQDVTPGSDPSAPAPSTAPGTAGAADGATGVNPAAASEGPVDARASGELTTTSAGTTDDRAGRGLMGDEQAVTEERLGVEESRDSTDPHEDPDDNYYFLGLFYRHTVLPAFLLDLFLEESTPASNPGFGAEFTFRKDGFDIIGSLWWQDASVTGPFRASGDPVTDVEWVESNLSLLWATATFLWSTPFNDIVAFEYGLGLGVGLVLGDLVRSEAYPSTEPGSERGFAKCIAPGNPPSAGPGYCDGPAVGDGDRGAHYDVTARKWTDGGSVPNAFLYVSLPHLAVRIKPIRQLMFRVEGGFSILGFFFGASANYGF